MTRVLALAQDAAAGERLLEWSHALARTLDRELGVVYLESVAALGAAELPAARVLAHAGAAWLPLSRSAVELGFRAQAARLRAATERLARRDALRWSFRVMRGRLRETSEQLWAEADLMFIAPAAATAASAAARPLVVALVDDSAAGQRARDLGQRLALALGGRFRPEPAVAAALRPDLLVLPRTAAAGAAQRPGWTCALLLVA